MKTAIEVIGKLKSAGFEAYLVGGAVRDFLIGKDPKDFDVATSADPIQVKELFSRTVDTGIQHGTVLVLINGTGVEVTTFRTESGYSDNRRPDSVEFVKSLDEDLKRRDFTINAMAMTEDLKVVDLFGGRKDLDEKIIRAVGEPDLRFQEDALRMLRAVRFSGQLDFSIDDYTLASIRNNAHLIRAIAVERLKLEMDKIMSNEHAVRSINYLVSSGLAEHMPAGDLFKADWSGFVPSADPLNGWLYAIWKNREDVSAISTYKLSNDEKIALTKSLEATLMDSWDEWILYSFTARQLNLAARIKKAEENWPLKKSELPIKSKSDLAVNGKNLIEWTGNKAGPWLKEALGEIERQVVSGKLQNDKEKIKDWFFDEYYRNE
ncbi:CCA tRNA nucleotidyltransferase [Planococcus sp. CAU13]|uniref:CCA tRNA nucleotidyltransferase n=1 Tax=Planococcus sp. CAU13 TaxID=1541197 RepID=UPI00053008DB|nr:CCA tRNA nucleotidyltransferase [Planococcus sp. CAU13]